MLDEGYFMVALRQPFDWGRHTERSLSAYRGKGAGLELFRRRSLFMADAKRLGQDQWRNWPDFCESIPSLLEVGGWRNDFAASTGRQGDATWPRD